MRKNLIFFLPNFNMGGAGNSILNICNNLNKKKYNLHIISLGKNFYKKQFLKIGASIIELNVTTTISSMLLLSQILSKYKKRNTIFISNINYANALSVIFVKLIKKFKLILVERTPLQELDIYFNLKDFFKKIVVKLIIRYFYRFSDVVIANSKKLQKILH